MSGVLLSQTGNVRQRDFSVLWSVTFLRFVELACASRASSGGGITSAMPPRASPRVAGGSTIGLLTGEFAGAWRCEARPAPGYKFKTAATRRKIEASGFWSGLGPIRKMATGRPNRSAIASGSLPGPASNQFESGVPACARGLAVGGSSRKSLASRTCRPRASFRSSSVKSIGMANAVADPRRVKPVDHLDGRKTSTPFGPFGFRHPQPIDRADQKIRPSARRPAAAGRNGSRLPARPGPPGGP